jgi:L-alanine-DL-glutamate epimerase-like enolase superfamily enzyme
VPISRYADPAIPSGGLTTSIVALETDVRREGKPVVGYGFSSIGRFAQSGLIRERFAPRLLAAQDDEVADDAGSNLDPFRAWSVMMRGEKPGGHGERCVAIGTLDMAIWDAAAKIAGLPLHAFLATRVASANPIRSVPVYAAGGYLYPDDDLARLGDEVRGYLDLGYTHAKIKIGAAPLAQDLRRIETALALLSAGNNLAADAMNVYDARSSLEAAAQLASYDLWWFEDVCDPLDFETQAAVARIYAGSIAAGEALFSTAEARLLDLHAGLRRDRDMLLFDPVHCYGLPGYLQIVKLLTESGWPQSAFWPHGGHLFTLHVVAALGLGGAEMNPRCFQPFGGLGDGAVISDGRALLPKAPGIGFETKRELFQLLHSLHTAR